MSDEIKAIEFPDKTFTSKEELFKELKAQKKELMILKCAQVKSSDSVPMSSYQSKEAIKAISGLDKDFIYPVINTTKYMDSHNDVHINGIWDKSVDDQQNKILYLVNHDLSVGKVIAFPKDVHVMTKEIKWRDLGADFDGSTQSLMFKTNTFAYSNKDAVDVIENKIDIEHSVRMQYVSLELAIDSSDSDYAAEAEIWSKHINDIANKGRAVEKGYFWAVTEAKIYKEGSMVLAGSNDVTPMVYPKTKPTPAPKGEANKSINYENYI